MDTLLSVSRKRTLEVKDTKKQVQKTRRSTREQTPAIPPAGPGIFPENDRLTRCPRNAASLIGAVKKMSSCQPRPPFLLLRPCLTHILLSHSAAPAGSNPTCVAAALISPLRSATLSAVQTRVRRIISEQPAQQCSRRLVVPNGQAGAVLPVGVGHDRNPVWRKAGVEYSPSPTGNHTGLLNT